MEIAFAMDKKEVLTCSGKTGQGVPELVDAIVENIPCPTGNTEASFRGLICDSWFDDQRGVILQVLVQDGSISKGDRIVSYHAEQVFEVQELGILTPYEVKCPKLSTGQVGYIIANIRNPELISLGETLIALKETKKTAISSVSEAAIRASIEESNPMPGFEDARPMVFAGLFAEQSQHYDQLRDALDKLTLNDASVTVATENSDALGLGFRCGFLGLLHMEVFTQRLEEEFGAEVIVTAPTVPYQLHLRDETTKLVSSPSEFPDPGQILEVHEPMVQTTIILPGEYLSKVMDICRNSRG
ncbi:hypothetical protein AAMO2058_001418600, partial [Amorphochlora amoebiformis]